MSAIYRREVGAYFHSMIGYVYMAVLLFFNGFYFMAYNLNYGYTHYSYALYSQGVVLLLAVALFAVTKMMPKTDLSTKTADVTLAPDAVEYLDETPAPEATVEPQPTEAPEITAEPTAAPESANMVGPVMPKQTDKVRGYVVITVAGRQYGDPIPMDRDKIITIKQDNGEINKIHITPEYVVMESSTCENQDCIGEGEVNVNTYKDRILSTYIICLPNQVTIEMVPADE